MALPPAKKKTHQRETQSESGGRKEGKRNETGGENWGIENFPKKNRREKIKIKWREKNKVL